VPRINQVVIESWRHHYNQVRPHASLGYRVPAPEVVVPAPATRMAGVTPPSLTGHPSRGPKAWPAPGKLVRKEGKFSGTFAPWG
jgi:hypothetical protein